MLLAASATRDVTDAAVVVLARNDGDGDGDEMYTSDCGDPTTLLTTAGLDIERVPT